MVAGAPGAVSKCQVCTYSPALVDRVKGFNYLCTYSVQLHERLCDPPAVYSWTPEGNQCMFHYKLHWYGTDVAEQGPYSELVMETTNKEALIIQPRSLQHLTSHILTLLRQFHCVYKVAEQGNVQWLLELEGCIGLYTTLSSKWWHGNQVTLMMGCSPHPLSVSSSLSLTRPLRLCPLPTPTQVLSANRRVPVKSLRVIGSDMKFSKCH